MSSVYQENLDFVKKGIRVCCEKLRDPEVTPVSGTFPAYRIHFGFRGTKNISISARLRRTKSDGYTNGKKEFARIVPARVEKKRTMNSKKWKPTI